MTFELITPNQYGIFGFSRQEAVAKNIALVQDAMRELCRNVLRAFMQSPSSADAALNNTSGQLRSAEADEMIRQLKVLVKFLVWSL
jgi:hypothetical protein